MACTSTSTYPVHVDVLRKRSCALALATKMTVRRLLKVPQYKVCINVNVNVYCI